MTFSGPRGVGGDGGGEGGVDAAGEADDDLLEAVLADVVPGADGESLVDFFEVGEGVREGWGGGVLRVGINVDNQEVFLELVASGQHVPGG